MDLRGVVSRLHRWSLMHGGKQPVVILIALCGMAAGLPAVARGEPVATAEVVKDANTSGIDEDPNLDHAWFMPTAITQPRGRWKISATELFWLGLSYGVTDNVSLTLGGMVPMTDLTSGWLTAKVRFLDTGRFHLAAHGSALYAHRPAAIDEFDDPIPERSVVLPSLGLAATLCLDPECRSLVSGYGGAARSFGDEDDDLFGLVGASGILHVTGVLKLMVELDQGHQIGWAGDDATLFAWYGVRLAGRSAAIDLGVLDPVGETGLGGGDIELDFLPWLKLAYRP